MQLTNLIIRPITNNDIDLLFTVAQSAGPGFTSLAGDKYSLINKITKSINSFTTNLERSKALYLLVMEDITNQNIAGICGIKAGVGIDTPYYSYKLCKLSQRSTFLNKTIEHQILYPVNDFNGATELVSLFVSPNYRGNKCGEILSKSRLQFIAQFPDRFADTVIAEIRGCVTESGNSPFWDSLGQLFFQMDFMQADELTSTTDKKFIDDLMPRYPIYTAMLSKEAQSVIGKPHPSSAPAASLLQRQGFSYDAYVDIFEAGPLITAPIENIDLVKRSRCGKVSKIKNKLNSKLAIICNTSLYFRLTLGYLEVNKQDLVIDAATANKLEIGENDEIRYFWY